MATPITVRLPKDLDGQVEHVLATHLLLRRSVLIAFALDSFVALHEADPTVLTQLRRQDRQPAVGGRTAVRLPADIERRVRQLLDAHPLLRLSALVAFAVQNAVAMIGADPSILEQFQRHRRRLAQAAQVQADPDTRDTLAMLAAPFSRDPF